MRALLPVCDFIIFLKEGPLSALKTCTVQRDGSRILHGHAEACWCRHDTHARDGSSQVSNTPTSNTNCFSCFLSWSMLLLLASSRPPINSFNPYLPPPRSFLLPSEIPRLGLRQTQRVCNLIQHECWLNGAFPRPSCQLQ